MPRSSRSHGEVTVVVDGLVVGCERLQVLRFHGPGLHSVIFCKAQYLSLSGAGALLLCNQDTEEERRELQQRCIPLVHFACQLTVKA